MMLPIIRYKIICIERIRTYKIKIIARELSLLTMIYCNTDTPGGIEPEAEAKALASTEFFNVDQSVELG